MNQLHLQPRYIASPARAPISEKEFVYKNASRSIPPAAAALILVDVWNDLYVAEFVDRARQITSEKIIPLARAFRSAGSLVVHAPSHKVAEKYPAFLQAMSDREIWGNPRPKHCWPPKAIQGGCELIRRISMAPKNAHCGQTACISSGDSRVEGVYQRTLHKETAK